MRVFRIALLILAACTTSAPAEAQAQLGCRHEGPETRAARQGREEALAAMRMINSLLVMRAPGQPFPSWEELANSPQLPALRSDGGRTGELARTIQWGAAEPLAGWPIHYVATADRYAFSLTDRADPCRFTYSTDDSGVIIEGYPITQRRFGVMPIT
jgi:hypothetical protein